MGESSNSQSTATATNGPITFGSVNLNMGPTLGGASDEAANTANALTPNGGTNWTLILALVGLAITIWFNFRKR